MGRISKQQVFEFHGIWVLPTIPLPMSSLLQNVDTGTGIEVVYSLGCPYPTQIDPSRSMLATGKTSKYVLRSYMDPYMD